MSAPTSSHPDDASSTSTRLLDVAERLFAEEGIASVSIRRIVLAGGQANLSAAHYHFGSREALIRRLIERRLRNIDAIRHRRLDALGDPGPGVSVASIVEAAVGALAEAVEDTPWGTNYVRVLAQALFDTRMKLLDTVDPELLSSVTRARSMARPLLRHLPEPVFTARVRIIHHESSYAIARWVAEHGRVTAANRGAYRAVVRDIIAFMAAGAAAPAASAQADTTQARAVGPRTHK
jgi:AcrR family transcriptional regulator